MINAYARSRYLQRCSVASKSYAAEMPAKHAYGWASV